MFGITGTTAIRRTIRQSYRKTITSIIGNTLSGQAKAPETLDWLQKLFGKVKQVKEGVTIRRNETTINMNEQMDFVIPASKISSLQAGTLVGQVALDFDKKIIFQQRCTIAKPI